MSSVQHLLLGRRIRRLRGRNRREVIHAQAQPERYASQQTPTQGRRRARKLHVQTPPPTLMERHRK